MIGFRVDIGFTDQSLLASIGITWLPLLSGITLAFALLQLMSYPRELERDRERDRGDREEGRERGVVPEGGREGRDRGKGEGGREKGREGGRAEGREEDCICAALTETRGDTHSANYPFLQPPPTSSHL